MRFVAFMFCFFVFFSSNACASQLFVSEHSYAEPSEGNQQRIREIFGKSYEIMDNIFDYINNIYDNIIFVKTINIDFYQEILFYVVKKAMERSIHTQSCFGLN